MSNFWIAPIKIDGKVWPTTEHYFQGMKFKDPEYYEAIRQAKTCSMSKRMGQSRKHRIHEDWDERRLDVMKRALMAKFTQHEDLKI